MADTDTTIGTTEPAAGAAANDGSMPAPPAILSGEEIYNMLMGQIEQELMTDQIPLMPEKYKSETPEESKARAERYRKAFEEYDKKYQEYQQKLDGSVRTYSHDVLKGAENVATQEDTGALQNIESAISSS